MDQRKPIDRDNEILAFWEREKIFEQTVERDAPAGDFVFYEGPPTANAPPGIHHVEARTFKDVIPRYKTMRGYRVRRKAGWDTHGLPVEIQVEKALGLKTKKDIERYGVAKFNAACRDSVWEFKEKWEDITRKIGYWVDLGNPYITYEMPYIESVWWFLKQAWEKGLLVRDYKIVHWCPRCETPLSSHEVALGYERIGERSVYLKFELSDEPGIFILAWTTTPWTLPGNVALAVDPKIQYAKVKAKNGECYYIADSLIGKLKEEDRRVEVKVLGSELIGKKYRPLFDFVDLGKATGKQAYYVAAADFVTTEDGTGVVHTAVMYGDDDFKLGTALDLPKQHTVHEDGTFNELVSLWSGKYVKAPETEQAIVDWLRAHNKLYAEEQYEHDYPFCWRCKTPLLYYARASWYITMSKLREELQAKNQMISWHPEHLKNGRFGEWLREVKDWAITRERFWGTPLPIWECDRCGNREIIGSFAELVARAPKRNRFLLMRHGESETNRRGVINSKIETSHLYPLTPEGRARVERAARSLKNAGITKIIASPFARMKETAEIVSKTLGIPAEYEDRLREIDIPDFDGKPSGEFGRQFASLQEKFTRKIGRNETWDELAKRMLSALADIDQKYEGETILICSHGDPLLILRWAYSGRTKEDIDRMEREEYPGFDDPKMLDFISTLVNERGELDAHRPFIDQITWGCACGGAMRRFPEVVDVWMDSGCMPFAQHHYPFEDRRGGFYTRPREDVKSSPTPPPVAYPADYISEAIDQTRGWFYTLLAVATVLGWDAPYRNVISLGHLLDAKGQKMSKSKGNVVDPWGMIEKYGADVVRWYMLTVNQPWDSKLFDEGDLGRMSRKPFGTLANVLEFWRLHGGGAPAAWSDAHILDSWLRARFAALHREVAGHLDAYEVTDAARAISEAVDDFSTWWLRRSRERLKEADAGARGSFTAALHSIAILLAPFAPFTAEHTWQTMRKRGQTLYATGSDPFSAESVHLASWDSGCPMVMETDTAILDRMASVRHICSLALEARTKAGVPVRQALAKLEVRVKKLELSKADIQLICEELNVKTVIANPNLMEEVMLDTTITPELKREGMIRELTRAVNNLRKEMGLTPSDHIRVLYAASDKEILQSVTEYRNILERGTAAVWINETPTAPQEIKINEASISIQLLKQ